MISVVTACQSHVWGIRGHSSRGNAAARKSHDLIGGTQVTWLLLSHLHAVKFSFPSQCVSHPWLADRCFLNGFSEDDVTFYKRDHKNTQTLQWKKLQKMRDKRELLGKSFGGFGPVKPPFHPHSPLDSISMLVSLKTAMPVIFHSSSHSLFTLICTKYSLLSEFNMAVGGLLFIYEIFAVFNTPIMYGLISVALLKANMCICLSMPDRYRYVCVWNLSLEQTSRATTDRQTER